VRSKTIILALLLFCIVNSVDAQAGNTIDGRIVDEHNVPVYNAFVELYNDLGVMLKQVRSSSQGRYSFRGLVSGRFTVKVKPFGTNLKEDSQMVELVNITSNNSDFETVDFHLRVDKRFESQLPSLKSTVYAQEIPAEAKLKYDSAMNKLKSNNEEGVAELESAVKIFPTYFDALSALGKKYVAIAKYKEGYETLLRAIAVYRRCGDCYYTLGLAFYKLDQFPAAVKAAAAAVLLEPLAPESHLLSGMALRQDGDLAGAEAALLKAESLYKKPNSEVHWQLSLVYNKMGQNAKAADRLELYLRDAKDIDKTERESVKAVIAKLRAAKPTS
jgi:tetratricopeptide (TPR) repeat protein